MSDAINSHDFYCIGNLIDDAIAADANPPIVFRSSKFAAAARTRIIRQTMQCLNHTRSHIER